MEASVVGCAGNKQQHREVKNFLKEFAFTTLPITENIAHRAAIYVEEYTLSNSIRAGDAIVAATAAQNNLPLCSGNKKHFSAIKEVQLKHFKRIAHSIIVFTACTIFTGMAVNIGEIIQSIRKKAGLTQKELADLAGVGKTTVFDIEHGKNSIRFSNVLTICRVLNISLRTKDPFGNETEVKDA